MDAVDLYQVHAWDPWTPLEETLRTLDGFVRSGKIRYYGFSNFTGWQLTKAVHTARALGLAAPVTLQPQYSLIVREIEWEIVPAVLDAGDGAAAVEPAGRRLAHRQVPARRASCGPDPARRGPRARHGGLGPSRHRAHLEIIDAVQRHRRGARAPRWHRRPVLGHQPPRVTSTILGARTTEQLEDNLGSSTSPSRTRSSPPSRPRATCAPPTTRTARSPSTSATATWPAAEVDRRPPMTRLPW